MASAPRGSTPAVPSNGSAPYGPDADLSRRPTPSVPDDLERHDGVHDANPVSGTYRVLEWNDELRRGHVVGAFASNARRAVLASVVAGEGIGAPPNVKAPTGLWRGAP